MQFVYLHGFQSNSRAVKAQKLRNFARLYFPSVTVHAPDYPDDAREAVPYLKDFFDKISGKIGQKEGEPTFVVGSSMGGFYATVLSRDYPYKAFLFNPCVHPQRYLKKLILNGEISSQAEILIEELSKLDESISFDPHDLFVYLKKGDEVLDYADALNFYKGCPIDVREGGDHGVSDFEIYLPTLFETALKLSSS